MPQQNEQREEEKKKKRGLIAALILVLCAVAIATGVIFAFFSDVITGGGTATSGTLDISGTIGINQNGKSVEGGIITNLNPGDYITIDFSAIENLGSKSAWIRSVIEFDSISNTNNMGGICSDTDYTTAATCEAATEVWTPGATEMTGNLADWLWVCPASYTQTVLLAASAAGTLGAGTTALCTKATVGTTFGEKASYAKPADVISGTAEEDGAPCTTTCAWAPETTDALQIYFDAAAPNAAQNGTMEFSVLIQALQYQNNTGSPSSTAWDTVVKTPFATP